VTTPAPPGTSPAPPGTSPAPPRMNGADRRDQLCSVARDLFVVTGFRGTTTSAVADAAGVSEALLIKHFGSKEALFREAITEPLMDVLRQAAVVNRDRARAGDHGSVTAQMARLREFGVEWARLVRRHGPLVAAAMREATDFPDVVEELRAVLAQVMEDVALSLGALTEGREYRPFDRKFAAYAGLAAMAAASLATDDIESYIDEYVSTLMLGLLSPAGREQISARS
jgi:AcrR family transcriptional regulator